jgi:predicted ATPase
MRGDIRVDTRVPFVGREALARRIASLLDSGRNVLLIGPGGVGKTRLAYEAVSAAEGRLPAGAAFVSLAGAADVDAVTGAIAGGLGISQAAGRSPLEALDDSRFDARTIVLLDNCERFAVSAAQAMERLARHPNVTVVATSRARMKGCDAEVVEVPPFDEKEGVAFFAARAQLAHVAIEPNGSDTTAVRGIVKKLDGLAVAIDLAAAKLASIDVRGLAEELATPKPYHFRSSSSNDPRHWTINSVVDWSLSTLDESAQRAFALAARFAKGFDANDVAAMMDVAPEVAASSMQRLADESLFVRSDANGAHSMLAPIRAVARRRLAKLAERRLLDARYAARMNDVAVELRGRLETPESGDAMDVLARRYDDFVEVLAWSLRDPPKRLASALEILFAMVAIWADGGRFDDGMRWCERFVDASGALDRLQRGRVYYAATRVAFSACEYDRMLALGPQMITTFTIAGDRMGLARAYNALGVASTYTGRFGEGETYVETALALYEAIGYERGIGAALLNRGALAIEGHGDPVTARDCYQRALEILNRAASNTMIALAHGNLAEASDAMHDPEGVERHAARSLELYEGIGDLARSAWQFTLLARAAEARGDSAQATSHLVRAFDLLERQPNPVFTVRAVETAAGMIARSRHFEEAAELALAARWIRLERRVPATGPALTEARVQLEGIGRRLSAERMTAAEGAATAIAFRDLPGTAKRALLQTFEASGPTMVEAQESQSIFSGTEQEH